MHVHNAMEKILVTGVAGFIGSHLARRLCGEGYVVTGIDNVNDYYDPALKNARLETLKSLPGFEFQKTSFEDRAAMEKMFASVKPDIVLHMGAQAGVRYSIDHPHAYISSNIDGFLNVLEGCRATAVKHLVFASSSSVYGANRATPFSVSHNVDHPISLYAATKKSNELMAHSYAHLYQFPVTGLRFFTVYGPWGRPDMAVYSFTRAIMKGEPIKVFNHGNMRRDFTYIDDVVEGVIRVMKKPAEPNSAWSGEIPDPASSTAPYRIYNIGNHQPVKLTGMIETLEDVIGIKAKIDMQPMQPGDVPETYADVDALKAAVGFAPSTPLRTGLEHFVRWYRDYHGND